MDKVVLVTGTSKGIGYAIADSLHNAGYKVYGTSRSPNKLDWPVLKLDVTSEENCRSVVKEIIEAEGRLDALVNNAGNAVVGPLREMDATHLQLQFGTNVFGTHRMVRAALPHLEKHRSNIINIGSFGGRLSIPYQVPYSMSKAAVAMYSDGLRMELSKTSVRVSLIEPGDTKTNFDAGRIWVSMDEASERAISIMRASEQNGADPQRVAKLVHRILKSKKPRGRYLTGSDAKLFGFLQRLLPPGIQQWLIMRTYKL